MSIRDVALTLLAARAENATICPSEIARAIAGSRGVTDWRNEMPAVHEAVNQMVADEEVKLTWQGAPRAVGDGPYRIRRGQNLGRVE